MKTEYTVKFDITIPETETQPTEQQVIDWLKYNLDVTAQLMGENPLSEHDLSSCEINYLSVR